jgi:nucleobase:cation symporter-1, NCS1 family
MHTVTAAQAGISRSQAMTEQLPKGYSPRLYNQDLGPLPQKWTWYNIFAFWMSDVHSVGGYVFAASLFALGLASWQVLIALLTGICIVQLIANLVAKPSQQAAVPYPVICRLAFGVFGANIPAVIRGLIAVAWYGIQTYLASSALAGLASSAYGRCRQPYSGPAWSPSAVLSTGRGQWSMR